MLYLHAMYLFHTFILQLENLACNIVAYMPGENSTAISAEAGCVTKQYYRDG